MKLQLPAGAGGAGAERAGRGGWAVGPRAVGMSALRWGRGAAGLGWALWPAGRSGVLAEEGNAGEARGTTPWSQPFPPLQTWP